MHTELEKIVKSSLEQTIDESSFQPFLDKVSDALWARDVEISRLKSSLAEQHCEFKGVKQELSHRLLENRASRNRLEEFAAKQQALLNATPEAVIGFNQNGQITQMNRAAENFVGIDHASMAKNSVKQTLSVILGQVADPANFVAELRSLSHDQSKRIQGYCSMKSGKIYEYHSIPEFLGNLFLGRVWCWRDVTDLRTTQERLRHQAFHDTLTDLPNRLHLINTLKHAIKEAQQNGSTIAVLFIDLDDFKKINDTEGHAAGDQFLVSVAQRICSKLREGDTFGRLGGDEFLILLEGLNHEHEIGIAYQRIKEIFDQPLKINGKQFFVSGSIGVSQCPKDSRDPQELIQKADMAMYQAKNQGKNTIYYYEPSLEKYALDRMDLEAQLRKGFERNEFYLCYQPKVDIHNNSIVGMEALLRWKKDGGEVVYPGHFVRTAEQIGLAPKITELVLRELCKQICAWRNTALANTAISMNLSLSDLRSDNFLNLILNTIKEFRVPGHLIEFELTENFFIEEPERTANIIECLKRWGIEVAIDDFGTGYSCFNYLQDMSIDCLKIDKRFTMNVSENEKSAAIVRSIIDIGNNLNIRVIAEGAESQADIAFLKANHCRYAQGHYYSEAVNADLILHLAKSSLLNQNTSKAC